MKNRPHIHAKSAKEYLELKSISGKDGCIQFDDSTTVFGYGNIGSTQWGKLYKVHGAHQLSYIVNNGDYDRKFHVCHACDNPICINQDHLWLGTPKDNLRDARNKGRLVDKGCPGELNGRSRLTKKDVLFIRKHPTKYTSKEFQEMFKLSQSAISAILTGRSWKHLVCDEKYSLYQEVF